ncbi:MAG: hypothetical protein M5U12_13460 [Verrucomicrobia bacterium]|nr:hypothetical protein [Verrucomicrobiota bacterium]
MPFNSTARSLAAPDGVSVMISGMLSGLGTTPIVPTRSLTVLAVVPPVPSLNGNSASFTAWA